jgi:hypothetical protein
MKVHIMCRYCGFKLVKEIYGQSSLENEKCIKCGDRDLDVKEFSKSTVDYYQGCPPFPDKNSVRKEPETISTPNDWGFAD